MPAIDKSNMTPLEKEVSQAIDRIQDRKKDRSAINDDIAAIRSGLEAKGIRKKALDMGIMYLEMDERDREGFDLAYDIVRAAIGLQYKPQGDLFIPPAKDKKAKDGVSNPEADKKDQDAKEGKNLDKTEGKA